jgi:hypothetical protein
MIKFSDLTMDQINHINRLAFWSTKEQVVGIEFEEDRVVWRYIPNYEVCIDRKPPILKRKFSYESALGMKAFRIEQVDQE